MSYSENYSDESISLNGGSNSGNEADFKRVEVYDNDIKKILSMRKIVNSSMYEPEKEIFSTSLSSESDYSGNSSNSNQLENAEVGNFNWCICGNCVSKKREIDCLCCYKVHEFAFLSLLIFIVGKYWDSMFF